MPCYNESIKLLFHVMEDKKFEYKLQDLEYVSDPLKREILKLKLKGHTDTDISKVLGISTSKVTSTRSRAVAQLERELEVREGKSPVGNYNKLMDKLIAYLHDTFKNSTIHDNKEIQVQLRKLLLDVYMDVVPRESSRKSNDWNRAIRQMKRNIQVILDNK